MAVCLDLSSEKAVLNDLSHRKYDRACERHLRGPFSYDSLSAAIKVFPSSVTDLIHPSLRARTAVLGRSNRVVLTSLRTTLSQVLALRITSPRE